MPTTPDTPGIQYFNGDASSIPGLGPHTKEVVDNIFNLRDRVSALESDPPISPPPPSGPNYIDGGIPVGVADGSNKIFRLGVTPNPPLSLQFFVAGVLYIQKQQSITGDYTLTGNTVVFGTAPGSGTVQYWCRY